MLASVKSIQGLKVSVLKREKFPLYVKKKIYPLAIYSNL